MAMREKVKTRMKFTNAVGFVRVLMHTDMNKTSDVSMERHRYSLVSSLSEYANHDVSLGEATLLFLRVKHKLENQWQGYLDKHPELQLYPNVSTDMAERGAKA